LTVGPHSLTADYGGDSNFNTSSGALTQNVSKADTSTALTSSVNPSVFGQSVTLTATVTAVAPGAGTGRGTGRVKDGGSTLGTGPLSGGVATFTTSTLTVGPHSLTADYGGDSNFNTSSGALTQNVSKADTSTALTSSVNPSVFGQSVTLTATVTAVAPGAGTRTGTVTFKDGGSTLGRSEERRGGEECTTSTLTVGPHSLTADYGGDSNFNTSSGALTQNVSKADTSTALTSSVNPSVFGQSVTLTATVTAAAAGAGARPCTANFKDGGSTLGTAPLSGRLATFTPSPYTTLFRSLTADYGGDSNFNTSSGALTQNVSKADTSTALTSSVNPSVFGQSVTLTATVT